MTELTEPRPARWIGSGDSVTLKVQCTGQDRNWQDELVPCQAEQRYEITQAQLDAYIEGAPLTDIWPQPDAFLENPRCPLHR